MRLNVRDTARIYETIRNTTVTEMASEDPKRLFGHHCDDFMRCTMLARQTKTPLLWTTRVRLHAGLSFNPVAIPLHVRKSQTFARQVYNLNECSCLILTVDRTIRSDTRV